MNDERLRSTYAVLMERRSDPERSSCVSPDALSALAEARGSEDARLADLDHVMSCVACRREFEMLRALHVARPRTTSRLLTRLALAAGFLLAVFVGASWWQSRELATGNSTMRSDAERIAIVGVQAELPGGDVRLVWHAVPQALDYEVEVLDAEHRLVYSAITADTQLALPESVRRAAVEGHHWWVRGRMPGGEQPASPIVPLRLPLP
jgi:hypothetical protein